MQTGCSCYFRCSLAFVLYVDIMLTPSLPTIASDYKVTIAEVSLVISALHRLRNRREPGDRKARGYRREEADPDLRPDNLLRHGGGDFLRLELHRSCLVSRTVQGIGLGIFPLAFSLVREEFPREMVPRAQGILSAMFGAGAALGLPIGALIANSYGWQTNYHIALPFIVVLTILIFYTVKESSVTNPNAKLDYVGAVWLGVTMGAIVFGLSEGSTWGWTSLPGVGSDLRRLRPAVPSRGLREESP